jgi:hypothetical protein
MSGREAAFFGRLERLVDTDGALAMDCLERGAFPQSPTLATTAPWTAGPTRRFILGLGVGHLIGPAVHWSAVRISSMIQWSGGRTSTIAGSSTTRLSSSSGRPLP